MSSSTPPSGRYYLRLSPEVEELVDDARIDLAEAVRERLLPHGVSVERDTSPNTLDSKGAKEPATILLAAGLTASMVAWAVSQVLDAIGRNKKVVVTERELRAVEDSAGNVVRTASGEPRIYATNVTRLIESARPVPGASLTGKLGSILEIELQSHEPKSAGRD